MHHDVVVSNLASNSIGTWSESRPRDRLFWETCWWFSSVPPGNCWDSTLKYATTTSFHCSLSYHFLFGDIRGCIRKFPDWVDNEINNNNIHLLRRAQRVMAIQLHLVAESCTICSSSSRRPVRKLLGTFSYTLERQFGNWRSRRLSFI